MEKILKNHDWRSDASCIGVDPNFFYQNIDSNLWDHLHVAKSICDGCAVKVECLDYAMINEEEGFWGGTTPEQRRKIKKLTTRHNVSSHINRLTNIYQSY